MIGINFEPEQTGIGPYTTGLAHEMVRRGDHVTVITGMPHYPQWKIDEAYRGEFRVTEQSNGVDVRRMRMYTPSQQSAVGRGLYELTFFLQAVSALRVPAPDLVIGVIPSLSGGAAAAVLARRYRVPLGLIFQDLMGQAAAQSGIPGGGFAASPVRKIEAAIARLADRVAVVAEPFRSYLIAVGVAPTKITHLPNWTHVDRPTQAPERVRQSLHWPAHRPVVLHAGNMGYKQELGNLVSAARLAAEKRPDLYFVLMGDGNERRRLETLASGLTNLVFVDPQPREVFMDIMAAADVLVLNERGTVLDMSLPSKITSYFRAGRPVVAAVRPGGTTEDELIRSGGALVVQSGDPAALLRALEVVVDDVELATSLVREAKTHAETHLNERALLDRLDGFVERLSMTAAARDQ